MKTFKDFLSPDLDNVFINLNEFADMHTIDGEEKKCIVDDDIFEERPSNQTTIMENGVYLARKSIFIKKDELDARPEIQELMELDGVNYLITNVKESAELYEIEVVRNEY